MAIYVAHFVNSFVNKPGNIGVRTGRILKYSASDFNTSCICRGAQGRVDSVNYHEMGFLGHIPRILNSIRIHLFPKFDHKKWDIKFFDSFAKFHVNNIPMDVAHVWEMSPRLIRSIKRRDVPVILDVPIAPSHYSEQLNKKGLAGFLKTSFSVQKSEREAILLADRIIAPSPFVAEVIEQMGVKKDRIVVVEFGVNFPDLSANRFEEKPRIKNEVNFCFVGNVNRRKGIGELLEAWQDEIFNGDKLHLCGRVNLDVKDILKKSKNNILTPGFVDPFDYLMNCDVFVLPSWLEGSAKSVYEAMACGLPSIVTKSTGSIIRDGVDGFVIEAGDVSTLRKRMLWFKENPHEIYAMGMAARERARQYTWERYAKSVAQEYKQLCRKNC